MFGLGSTALGITLIALGVVFLILTPLLLRLVPHLRRVTQTSSTPAAIPTDLPSHENAVLLVQPGGRVAFINEQARQWFNLLENETPNLERLARNTRPTEAFLNLCAAAGQTRFNLHQALVEGISYYVPFEGQQAVMVTMQQLQLRGLENGESEPVSQSLTIFNEISQNMSASLDLETTIETILDSVDRLVPSDFSEITLWDHENENLIPYRYLVDDDGIRRLRMSTDRYQVSEGYSGYMISNGQPLLVEKVSLFTKARPTVSRHQFPINSFLGLPLRARGNIIGTIELATQTPEAFNQGDLEVLETLSGHAAIALQNAMTHFKEQQRATEMAGLAELSQVSSTIYEADELYQHLIEFIAPLLNVEILGFLIYNEATHALEGQVPFLGLPEQFTVLYNTEIDDDGPARKLWEEQDIIITDNVDEDSPLGLLGLSPLAQAAGIRETVLLPLTSGRRSLGYLQVANKLDRTSFTDDDLRLLRIIAGHASPILENAHLIQESRRRAQRAEALRRVASLAGSGATIDEILKFSTLELNRFLQANLTAVILLDENVGRLTLHEESLIGMEQENIESLNAFLAGEAAVRETVTASGLPLIFDDLEEDSNLSSTYGGVFKCMPETRAAVVVPLIIRDRGIGELIITSNEANFFDISDSLSATTAASQLASALERSALLSQTDESLQRRVDQLTMLSHIVADLNTAGDLKQLLRQIYEEVLRITQADDGAILIYKMEAGKPNFEEVSFYQGQPGCEQVGDIERRVIDQGEPVIVEDFAQSKGAPPSADVRAALIVPIIYLGNVIGLIHLHSKKPGHFD
ncbi:MAG: hypothetical protein AMS22_11960, partial [Thiotrichales bacterium SG8_50]